MIQGTNINLRCVFAALLKVCLSCVNVKLESGLSGPPLVFLQPEVKGSNEDEDLSELQLRLLALQSASRKWQQKEQQVMKESKDKITKAKPSQEKSSSTSSAKPPERGRVTTRSASAASEKAKALANKPQEKTKAGAKPPAEKGKAPVKGYPGRKTVSPGEQGLSAYSDPNCPLC